MIPEPTWTPSAAEYHRADGRVSSSTLKTFRRNRRLFHDYYVSRTCSPPTPTPAMVMGNAVDEMLLRGPDRVVGAGSRRNTNDYKAAVDEHGDKIVVTMPEYYKARAIAHSIERPMTPAARAARKLLLDLPGHAQYAITWREGEIECKAMLDRIVELPDGRVAKVELKTSVDASPDAFARQAWNLDYPAQAAFYRRGAMTCGVTGPLPVLYVVIRNEEPFDVYVLEASDGYLEEGDRMVSSDLEALCQCIESDDWSNEAERLTNGFPSLDLPAWVKRQNHKPNSVLEEIFS